MHWTRLLLVSIGLALTLLTGGFTQESEPLGEPIKIILVAGGESYSGESFRQQLTDEIERRIRRPLEWTIKETELPGNEGMKALFPSAAWADGFDVVLHFHYLPNADDEPYLERILFPHTRGKPAVVIGESHLSFQEAGDSWLTFCGVSLGGDLAARSVSVESLGEGGLGADLEAITYESPDSRELILEPEGFTVQSREKESEAPLVWTGKFQGNARVYSNALGKEGMSAAWESYIDSIAKGILWSLGEDWAGEFISGEKGAIPEFTETIPEPHTSLRLGFNSFRSAGISAFSLPAMPQEGMGNLIDGDTATSWRLAGEGPGSVILTLSQPEELGALVIVWEKEYVPGPVVEIRRQSGEWTTMEGNLVGEFGDISWYQFERGNITSVRISHPDGNALGISEVAGFGSLAELPASLLLETPTPEAAMYLYETPNWGKFELADGWEIEPIKEANGLEARQKVPTAEGGLWLYVRNPEDEETGCVFRVGHGKLEEFLYGISPSGGIAWDGEWLYLNEIEVRGRGESLYSVLAIHAYRDTNLDGIADERFEFAEVDLRTVGIEGEAVQWQITDLVLGPGGEFYAILSSAAQGDLVIRFGRYQGIGTTLLDSRDILQSIRVSESGEVLVEAAVDDGMVDVYRLDLIPEVNLESIDPIKRRSARRVDSQGGGLKWRNQGERSLVSLEGEETTSRPVADLPPIKEMAPDGSGGFWGYLSSGGKEHLFRLRQQDEGTEKIRWDELTDREVEATFSHEDELVRVEGVFEFSRRKRAFRGSLENRFRESLGDRSLELASLRLARLKQGEGDSSVFVQATQSKFPEVRALAFYFLGDVGSEALKSVVKRIEKEKDPRVSSAIIGAVARQGLEIEGLEALVLNLFRESQEELVSTSRAFLVKRDVAEELSLSKLDDEVATESWGGALDLLLRSRDPKAFETLMTRLRQTRSAEFRSLAVLALSDWYPELAGDEQAQVVEFFNESISNKRFDRGHLLKAMKSAGMPITNRKALAEVAEEQLTVEAKAVAILEPSDLPATARDWLVEAGGDEHRDPDLRLRAMGLLAARANAELLRKIFYEVEEWNWDLLSGRARQEFHERWSGNDSHGDQIKWLIDQTRSSESIRRELAWRPLIRMMQGGDGDEMIETRIESIAITGGARRDELNSLAEAMKAENVIGRLNEASSPGDLSQSENSSISTENEPNTNDQDVGEVPGVADGMVSLGKDLFRHANCASCHSNSPNLLANGPDLSLIEKGSEDLDWGHQSDGYREAVAGEILELDDGRRLRVLELNRESEGSLLKFVDEAGNLFELEPERVRNRWAMKERFLGALFDSLSEAEMASLRAYLEN